MKTTSYELSKKLAEIGFKAESAYLWFEKDQAVKMGDWICPINEIKRINKEAISYLPENNISYPAYDLETILEALPKEIERDNGFNIGLRFWWADGASWIGYQNFSGFIITVDANQNESLADTAARLLILLHEKGIINFNEGK